MSPGGMTPRGQREFIEVGGWGSPRAAPGICLSRGGANLAQPGLGPTPPPWGYIDKHISMAIIFDNMAIILYARAVVF